jgi:dihydroorotase
VLDQKSGQFDYTDCIGEQLIGDKRLVSNGVVLAGRWWHPI